MDFKEGSNGAEEEEVSWHAVHWTETIHRPTAGGSKDSCDDVKQVER